MSIISYLVTSLGLLMLLCTLLVVSGLANICNKTLQSSALPFLAAWCRQVQPNYRQERDMQACDRHVTRVSMTTMYPVQQIILMMVHMYLFVCRHIHYTTHTHAHTHTQTHTDTHTHTHTHTQCVQSLHYPSWQAPPSSSAV